MQIPTKESCHCEEGICSFRRSNLLAMLEIASGNEQERPRNDGLIRTRKVFRDQVTDIGISIGAHDGKEIIRGCVSA